MSLASSPAEVHDIVVDEIFPHAPETIWAALTNAALIGRWMMPPTGFEAVVGTDFTFRTTAAGAWDGTIRCRVTEVVPNRRLAFSWKGGDAGNVGYGAPLDTMVTWTLAPVPGGTCLTLVHSGFVLPRNETAFTTMSKGWTTVVRKLDAVAGETE